MSIFDSTKTKDGKPMPPLYGGAKDLSYVHTGKEDVEITPKDLYNQKYSFRTQDEFKYLVSYYLDAMKKKKGFTNEQLCENVGKSPTAFAVMKYDGVSTFELFMRWCYALGIDPVQTFKKCLELARHFRNK